LFPKGAEVGTTKCCTKLLTSNVQFRKGWSHETDNRK